MLPGCSSSLPSGGDAEDFLEQKINSESKGSIELVDFEKINASEQAFFGTNYYVVEFSSIIEFKQDCRWITGHMGEFEGFETRPVDNRKGGWAGWNAGFSNPGANVKNGLRVQIVGNIYYEKTENGWRATKIEVEKKQKLDD